MFRLFFIISTILFLIVQAAYADDKDSIHFEARETLTTYKLLSTSSTFYPTSSFTSSFKENNKRNEIYKFIESSWDSLLINSSQGDGEFLNSLAQLYQCNETGKTEFKKQIKINFEELFKELNSKNAKELNHRIYLKFRPTEVFGRCHLIE